MWTFEWDNSKARSNLKKHGVSFEEAKTVYYDHYARLIGDPDHSDHESRFVLLGMSERLRLLVVCHCDRNDDSSIRIISARKATKREHKMYEGYLPWGMNTILVSREKIHMRRLWNNKLRCLLIRRRLNILRILPQTLGLPINYWSIYFLKNARKTTSDHR